MSRRSVYSVLVVWTAGVAGVTDYLLPVSLDAAIHTCKVGVVVWAVGVGVFGGILSLVDSALDPDDTNTDLLEGLNLDCPELNEVCGRVADEVAASGLRGRQAIAAERAAARATTRGTSRDVPHV